MHLPTVRGSNLNRQKRTFPANFAADVNLVFIAFQQWHQRDVNGWVPLAEHLEQSVAGFHYYEFPTIYEMNSVRQFMLNEGMRAGIPSAATRARTVTLYLDKPAFRRALDIPNEDNVWLYLFDRSGRVLWRLEGAYAPEKGKALVTAVANAISPTRASWQSAAQPSAAASRA